MIHAPAGLESVPMARPISSRFLRLIALLGASALVVAACSDSGTDTTDTTDTADAADPLGSLIEFLGERERLLGLELGQELAVDGGLAAAIAAVSTLTAFARIAAMEGAWPATPCITVADV